VLKQKKESKIKKQSIQKAEASKIDVKVQNIPIKKNQNQESNTTKTKKITLKNWKRTE